MKKKENIKDERDIKIARMSMTYSWSFTYLLIAVLVMVDHFKLVMMSAQVVLSIIFFSMVAVQLLAKMHFERSKL